MAANGEIVLLDLPSREPCKAWNMHPWKIRLLLNYKGLNYRTKWTEYPDIKANVEDRCPPNAQGPAYSVPTVILPDERYVTDSRRIAHEIEKLHPSPPIHLDSAQLEALQMIMPRLILTLTGVYISQVPRQLLNEASHAHWYRTRIERVGMPLDQFEQEKGGQTAWDNAKPILQEITTLLKENTNGPYFLGDTVSYTDFVWAGFLIFLQRLGSHTWDKLLETLGDDAELHAAFLAALDPWRARDDR